MTRPSLPPDATVDEWVEAVAAAAPPLTPDVVEKLRALLSPTVQPLLLEQHESSPTRKAA